MLLAMGVLIAVGFALGVLFDKRALSRDRRGDERRCERCEERREEERREEFCGRALEAGTQTEPATTENKGSQGPCTYARHRVQPRFVPLPEVAWGREYVRC